jgi:hypothetical protein
MKHRGNRFAALSNAELADAFAGWASSTAVASTLDERSTDLLAAVTARMVLLDNQVKFLSRDQG